MSVKIICDVCGEVIGDIDTINVFRMWNIPIAHVMADEGLSHIGYDDDFYLCNRCFNNLMDSIEELRKHD
jgi:hypothetical protein